MSTGFSYIKHNEISQFKQQQLKMAFENVEQIVQDCLHDGRAKSLCMTKLEEAYMWAGKAICYQQILEEGFQGEQVDRGDE